MKRFLILMLALFVATLANAQENDPEEQDTVKRADRNVRVSVDGDGVNVQLGDKTECCDDEEDEEDEDDYKIFDFDILGGLDLGFNTFMVDGDLNLPSELDNFDHKIGNSTNVQIRFFNLEFRPSYYARLNFALALDYNDWALRRNVTLQPDQDDVTFLEEDIAFSKNKFKAKYLALPVNLQIRTFSGVSFTGGFEPQFLLRGRVKQRSDLRGKTKVDDNYNLREFRYAVVGRVGYNNLSVFCRYYPESIFADNQGPDMQNISFGIGLGL